MHLELVLLTLALAALPCWADDQAPAPSPRQGYQRALVLFAQGHEFTADEQKELEELRTQLVDSGDADLAANLDLLRLGSATTARVNDLRSQDAASVELDSDEWAERQQFQQNRDFWRTVRNAGLAAFTASTVVTLLLASINDNNEAYLKNNSDGGAKQTVANGLNWALVGSASTMFLSLFPLLWGEVRQ